MRYDSEFNPMTAEKEGESGFSFGDHLLKASRRAMRAKGPGIDSPQRITGWITNMPPWVETGFTAYYVALGPWKPNMPEKERYASELLRQNFFRLVSSHRPLLLAHGNSETDVDRWIMKSREEVSTLSVHAYVKWLASYAIKPE